MTNIEQGSVVENIQYLGFTRLSIFTKRPNCVIGTYVDVVRQQKREDQHP